MACSSVRTRHTAVRTGSRGYRRSLPTSCSPTISGASRRYIEAACARVPILGSVGVKPGHQWSDTVCTGRQSAHRARRPGRRNFFHCCAFTFGIVQAGGAGRIIAEWVVNGQPDWDVWPLDSRRYLPFADRTYALAQGARDLSARVRGRLPAGRAPGGPPGEDLTAVRAAAGGRGGVRGARRLGAGGLLRAVRRIRPDRRSSFRRPHWHRAVARECAAVANGVALLDLPGFAKFEVTGAGRRGVARSPDRRIAAARGTGGAQLPLLSARRHRHRDDRDASAGRAILADLRGGRRASRRGVAARAPAATLRPGAASPTSPRSTARSSSSVRARASCSRASRARTSRMRPFPGSRCAALRIARAPAAGAARELRRRARLGAARAGRSTCCGSRAADRLRVRDSAWRPLGSTPWTVCGSRSATAAGRPT